MEKASTRTDNLLHLPGVSWGELTSSKLQAPSYEEAGTRADNLLHLFRRLVGRAYQLQAPSS